MSTTFFDFFNNKNIIAGYTTDFNGLWRFCNSEDVSNFESFSAQFGLTPKNLVRVHQQHTDGIIEATLKDGGRGILFGDASEGIDGIITKEKGLMPCILTADCASVYLHDPKNEAIGLVHSGRAGTMKEIAAKAAIKMKSAFGTNPSDLKCIIGPYISKPHHEVEKKDIEGFSGTFSEHEINQFISNIGPKYYVDMGTAIKISLSRVGVRNENIFDCHMCTFENSKLYSWRRDHLPDKRILSFISCGTRRSCQFSETNSWDF